MLKETAGALRLRGLRLAVRMQLASTGGLEPRALRPCQNDISCRCNRGNRTLDTAVMSCLLYPTELHCSGGHGCVSRGTHSSIAAACQCGWNHSRGHEALTRTSVTMSAHDDAMGTHQKSSSAAGGRISACRLHGNCRIKLKTDRQFSPDRSCRSACGYSA